MLGIMLARPAASFITHVWSWQVVYVVSAVLMVLLSFVPTLGAEGGGRLGVAILVPAAIALDFAVSGNLVLGQRAIYALGAEVRGRVNGLYMATFFLGGATGSALGAWSFAHGGWQAACTVGMGLIGAVFLVFLTES